MQKKGNNKEQKATIYKAEKQEKINKSKAGPQKTLIKLIHCFKKGKSQTGKNIHYIYLTKDFNI